MNNKSYIVLVNDGHVNTMLFSGHPYTNRYDAECRAYEYATKHPTNTYYVAEIQTKYKAQDVVVTDLT